MDHIVEKGKAERFEEAESESAKDAEDEETIEEIDEDESKETKEEKDDFTKEAISGKTKKLMNQFNFCERATITYDNTLKVKSVMSLATSVVLSVHGQNLECVSPNGHFLNILLTERD